MQVIEIHIKQGDQILILKILGLIIISLAIFLIR
jgi:hypothetical protein